MCGAFVRFVVFLFHLFLGGDVERGADFGCRNDRERARL